MKRTFCILLSAFLLLSFCGCRSSGLPGSSTAAATTETTVPVPTREPKVQLEFFLEGMAEYQDATLYVGDGYSLYITDDNWLETPGENGKMTWTSGYNPDIVLKVIPNAGATFPQARDALFDGYACFDEDGEYVYGRDASGGFYRTARLIETPDGILAAVWDYSLEATEGIGARLYVIAGTLEATHG